jgi:hypothetical protein
MQVIPSAHTPMHKAAMSCQRSAFSMQQGAAGTGLPGHPSLTSSYACSSLRVRRGAPRVLENLADRDPLLHVAVQHESHEIDALLAHDPGNTEVVVHDLIDGVEWVFLVDDGIDQDAESPYVLLLATIRVTRKDLRRGVVY